MGSRVGRNSAKQVSDGGQGDEDVEEELCTEFVNSNEL
jgi:hypothetical protein